MQFTNKYASPLGGITLASDGESLTGVWFDGQKYFGYTLSPKTEDKQLPVFEKAKEWLDCYFGGSEPNVALPVKMYGSEFRMAVVVPCHRVVGTNGSLTGFGGGIQRKIELLKLERVNMDKLFVPQSLII